MSFGVAIAGTQVQAAEPVPIGNFFKRSNVTSAVVSPSGRYIALTQPGPPDNRQRLVVVDLNDLSKSKPVAGFSDVDVIGIAWVNDDRLVFSVVDRLLTGAQQRGSGLFMAARDGTSLRRLVKNEFPGLVDKTGGPTSGVDHELAPNHRLFSTLRDGSDDVIVQRFNWGNNREPLGSVLLRLNTVTGNLRSISAGAPDHVFGWALDGDGNPRAAYAEVEGRGRIYVRAKADGPWVQIRDYDLYESGGRSLDLLRVLGDGKLYAEGYDAKGGDTTSLLRIDLEHPDAGAQTLMALDGYDFKGSLRSGAGDRLLGISYLSDARGTHWFDARMKKIQVDVDAALPGTVNILDCGLCADPKTVLVKSWSDRQPAIYRLYDTEAKTLSKMIESRPWIDPARMAKRDLQTFKARDGLAIPTFVTRPPGVQGPAPMVVLVHGGPFARVGEWEWDADSQFLASRGYVVVEPEFRGTTGFGYKLFRAGWKQWGLAMQDDVADAARWAIKQGYADPKRVCIAGASYGGYATLMGLVRDSDLYRCGFEWVGVTDIDLMYSINWSDTSEEWKRYGMPRLVGDPEKDAQQLADTSPIKQAARITRPLLMAYGGQDYRVPLEHGTKFRDAVKEHNPNVEWVVYPTESHGWFLEATDLDFWGRVERFLDRNLKEAP
ncbi:MAG: S9 family peptidase [Proteobacteria bacterium]|nr:S9 family peptidase [Pseudomonadota bacterium]